VAVDRRAGDVEGLGDLGERVLPLAQPVTFFLHLACLAHLVAATKDARVTASMRPGMSCSGGIESVNVASVNFVPRATEPPPAHPLVRMRGGGGDSRWFDSR
jgi:hypothetical protein